MFEKLSVKITDVFESKGIIQPSNKEVCAYGLRQLFSTILNAGTMLVIGLLMHMMIEAIVFTTAYIPVRIYAGGFHASTPQRCWAFSAIMLFVALCTAKYMPNKLFWLFTILSLIACIVIFLLSPVEDKNKTLDEKEHYVYHFRTSCVLASEIILAFVLYIMRYQSIILIFEVVWCSLAIMLVLGMIKNKKEEIDEQEN